MCKSQLSSVSHLTSQLSSPDITAVITWHHSCHCRCHCSNWWRRLSATHRTYGRLLRDHHNVQQSNLSQQEQQFWGKPSQQKIFFCLVFFFNLSHFQFLSFVTFWRGKSGGQSPRDFPRAQPMIHCISRLESYYKHSQFPIFILPVLSFLVGQYWKSWFSVLVWQLGLYFPVLPSRWSNTGPYRPSRELCCGSTRKYTWSGEQY